MFVIGYICTHTCKHVSSVCVVVMCVCGLCLVCVCMYLYILKKRLGKQNITSTCIFFSIGWCVCDDDAAALVVCFFSYAIIYIYIYTDMLL